MSTYANGTQQTYQQIWASMELACAGLMPAIRPAAPQSAPASSSSSSSSGTIVDVTPSAIGWPGPAVEGHRRKHPLRIPRRSARGRRRIAARIR